MHLAECTDGTARHGTDWNGLEARLHPSAAGQFSGRFFLIINADYDSISDRANR